MKEAYLIKVKQITDVYEPVSNMYTIRLKSMIDSVTLSYDCGYDYVEQVNDFLTDLGMNVIAVVHKSDNKCLIVVENLTKLDKD